MECRKDLSNKTGSNMKRMILFIVTFMMFGCSPSKYLQRNNTQLSKPNVTASKVFFDNEATIKVGPTAKGAKIEYSISDDKIQTYSKPIVVTESSKVTFQAVGGGYIPSSKAHLEVVKIPSFKNNSISSSRALSDKYGLGGLDILVDVEKGLSDFNKGWLGYLGYTIDFAIAFDERAVDQVVVSTLKNHRAWIFNPKQINIYANGKMLGTQTLQAASEMESNSSVFTKIKFPKIKTNQITIEIIAPEQIPAWHTGIGNKPWVFIDEILIY